MLICVSITCAYGFANFISLLSSNLQPPSCWNLIFVVQSRSEVVAMMFRYMFVWSVSDFFPSLFSGSRLICAVFVSFRVLVSLIVMWVLSGVSSSNSDSYLAFSLYFAFLQLWDRNFSLLWFPLYCCLTYCYVYCICSVCTPLVLNPVVCSVVSTRCIALDFNISKLFDWCTLCQLPVPHLRVAPVVLQIFMHVVITTLDSFFLVVLPFRDPKPGLTMYLACKMSFIKIRQLVRMLFST